MKFVYVLGLAAASVALSLVSPALASDHGCGHRAIECYDKVRLPDVYAMRTRQLVVAPGRREVVQLPPVVIDRPERVEVRPGRWHAEHVPALYSTWTERILVSPPRVTYSEVPAKTRTVRETVVVREGSVHWEHSRSRFGNERMCKVASLPVTREIVRDVVVAPARRVAHVSPAVFHEVERPVLLRRASVRHTYELPVHAFVTRQVMVRPPVQRIIDHPPVVALQHDRVLVRQGGYGWAPARRGLFDHGW